MYATHLPSGEISGPNSRAGPVVTGTIRENRGERLSTVAGRYSHVDATETSATSHGTRADLEGDVTSAVGAPAVVRASSISTRVSPMSRRRCFGSLSKHRR